MTESEGVSFYLTGQSPNHPPTLTRRKVLAGKVCSLGLFYFPRSLRRSLHVCRKRSRVAGGWGWATVSHATVSGLQPRVGARAQSTSISRRLLQEQVRSTRDYWPRSERAAAELERERRNIFGAMRSGEPRRGGPRQTARQPTSTATANRDQCGPDDQFHRVD